MLGAGEDQGALDLPRSSDQRSVIVSSACFSAWSTKVTYCSTRSAVVAAGATETRRIGQELVGKLADRFGMVAEKNRVWRWPAASSRSCLSAWMKPRSSIWSASSSTRISTSARR